MLSVRSISISMLALVWLLTPAAWSAASVGSTSGSWGAVTALAQGESGDPAASSRQDLDRQVREIGLELRCPVCQNLPVADSPSPLAQEMRAVIRQKLEAGESRQDILAYFVQRYGEGVLLDPPRQGFTMLVWLGAALAVTGGLGVLAVWVRRRLPGKGLQGREQREREQSAAHAPAGPLTEEERERYEAMLDSELALHGEGGGQA
jgi:cytochrome c-type biogenesis protein CcmH